MGKILEVLGSRLGGSLVLLGVVLVVFGSTAGHSFTLDSKHFLPDDPRIRDFQIGGIFTTDYWNHPPDAAMAQEEADLYRPVTILYLAVLQGLTPESQLAENRSVIINLGNVLLHALSVILRFLLFRRIFAGRAAGDATAFLAAFILAVHPVATEAVCTQIGASESLAAVCATGSLLVFLRWRRGGTSWHAVASGGLLLLGLLSKENALVAAAAAPLLALIIGRESIGKAIFSAVPAALAVLAWAGIRWSIFGAVIGVGDPVYAGFTAEARIATALASVWAYDVPALFWPSSLLPVVSFQDLLPAGGLADSRALAGATVLLLLTIGAVFLVRTAPPVAFGILFFLLAFLPVSNLATGIGAIAATRFLYLPLSGIVLALASAASAMLLSERTWPRRAGVVASLLMIVVPVWFCWREVPVWRDEIALFGAAFDRSPSTFSAYNHGVTLQERAGPPDPKRAGPESARLMREARGRFERAVQIPRPAIPGTDLVPEDLLDIAFKASMNAGLANMMFPPPDLPRARAFFLMAGEVARTGAAQTGKLPATTVWTTLQSDVEMTMADLGISEASLERDSALRAKMVAEAEAALGRARRFWDRNWKAELVALRMFQLRKDEAGYARTLEALHVRSRPEIQESSRAAEVAVVFGEHLLKKGERERGIRILLEACLLGPDRVATPEPFFHYGREAVGLGDPGLRKLGREALEIFLKKSARRVPALAQQRLEARRLLQTSSR